MNWIKEIDDICTKYKVLYIPNVSADQDIFKRLSNFYDDDQLIIALTFYIKGLENRPFIPFDFATQIHEFVKKAQEERRLKEEFKKVLKSTEGRM